jgi:type I restriction enzyme, R subunit
VIVYESDLEEACLGWFARLGYEVLESDNLDPEGVYDERKSYESVVIEGRLRAALHAINGDVPEQAIEQAVRQLLRRDAPTLEQNNFDFHRLLTDGVTVELAGEGGRIRGHRVRLFDFDQPANNDWVVANQFVVVDSKTGTGQACRPDVVVWVNGLPLAVLELKNPASEQSDVWRAYNQLQNYKRDIPSLFATNELLVISDDVLSRVGSLTADKERFQPWRAVDNEEDVRVGPEQQELFAHGERLQALIEGLFEQSRFLDLVRSFVTFEQDDGRLIKKLAGYHQFHAVRRAVDETVRATAAGGDRRIGVIWHTQGSGKSLTMAFYAGKLVVHPALENPTLVVITDRNDLDGQLFGTFAQAEGLLRQAPLQAQSREDLRDLLNAASGGIYFTTIQKFLPPDGQLAGPLSTRRNIVVIADEAHRSQYGLRSTLNRKTGEIRHGLAKHLRDTLPNASFVGFTGTPIELEDKSTIEVFGDHISVYDIQRAVEDGATVPIYYESRLARLALSEDERPSIDAEFEEITEDEEDEVKEGLKSQWSTIETLVGTPKRLALVAKDIVEHFERRNSVMNGGKALIVCMSRRICIELYDAITALRPEWHADEDDSGQLKVVMTGSSSDRPALKRHARTKGAREALAKRFKDPKDELKLVIVRDMWLTGFDAPSLHTLYVDKPMQGHNLMQAIARVNRVYGEKPGGLVVDYLGLLGSLKEAMRTYVQRGGKGDPTRNLDRAVEVMLEKLELCRELFHGFDYQAFFGSDALRRLDLLPAARQHVLSQRTGSQGTGKQRTLDGYDRFMQTVSELSKAAAIASTSPEYDEARNEIAFFQAVKAGLVKLSPGRRQPLTELHHAVRQIVENAIVSDQVIDVFAAAGLEKPDVSILSDEFLAELQGMRHKDLAAAALERLLRSEIKHRSRINLVQGRSFEEMLEAAVSRYISRSIDAKEVIDHLIEIARAMREAERKGEELGLTPDEFAFYEALADNQSARAVLGDGALATMAHELTALVRKNASIDWTKKASVQAKLRLLVKKLLKDRGYPPDAQRSAVELVLRQAERLGINVSDGAPDPDQEETPPSAKPAPSARTEYPFPIAIFDNILASQVEPGHRVKTQLDAIERALMLVAISEIAWLRGDSGELPAAAASLVGKLGGKRISMGAWLELAWQLAALLPREDGHPIVRAARQLVTDQGKPSELTKTLQQHVVPLRNDKTHGVTVAEEALAQHEVPLREHWQRLKSALSPLVEMRLLSKANLKDFSPDGSGVYNVRDLTGDRTHFQIKEVRVHGKLEDHWVYWLKSEGSKALSLRPMCMVKYRDAAGAREIFLPRTLELGPGKEIELMQLTGSETIKETVPAP